MNKPMRAWMVWYRNGLPIISQSITEINKAKAKYEDREIPGYFVTGEWMERVRELIERGEKLCAAQLEVAKMFHPDEHEDVAEAKAILEKHRAALAAVAALTPEGKEK